jgi:hypothetical protein
MRRLGSGLRLEERNVKRALLARRFAARHADCSVSKRVQTSNYPVIVVAQPFHNCNVC